MPTYQCKYPYQYNNELGPVFMSLRTSRTIFTCGDRIKGTILVKTYTRAKGVTVSLKGRSSCSKNDNTTLLSFTQTLFSGPGTIPVHVVPSFVEFPFEFTFPQFVELDSGKVNNATYQPSTIFEHQPGHLLPPSLWAKDGSAKIEYYIEAHIISSQIFFGGKTELQHQLRFSPSVSTNNLMPPPLTACLPVLVRRQTRLLDPAIASGNRGSLARLKDTIHREEAPSATFSVTVNVPSEIRAGDQIPLSISLVHLARSNEIKDLPVVSLRSIVIRVKIHIHARVPLIGSVEGEHRSAVTEDKHVFTSHFNSPGILMYDGMTFDSCSPRPGLDPTMLPSFRSYGVSATHDLKFKLVVECAGRSSEIDFVREGITFLPKALRGSSVLEDMGLPEYEENGGPPPYEE